MDSPCGLHTDAPNQQQRARMLWTMAVYTDSHFAACLWCNCYRQKERNHYSMNKGLGAEMNPH